MSAGNLPQQVPSLGRVLVVDDEVKLLETLCEWLSAQGYLPVGSTAGAEALETLRRENFDLLLTDLVMPGMSGWELAEQLGALRPGVPVVYMSGYAEFPGARGRTEDEVPMLHKPFTPQGLALAVRQALDNAPPH